MHSPRMLATMALSCLALTAAHAADVELVPYYSSGYYTQPHAPGFSYLEANVGHTTYGRQMMGFEDEPFPIPTQALVGNVTIPVFLIDWSDFDPETDLSNMDNPSSTYPGYVRRTREEVDYLLNQDPQGAAAYYREVSGGQLNITFEVFDWMVSDQSTYLQNRIPNYYYQHSNGSWYTRPDKLYEDVLASAIVDFGLDLRDYDADGNKVLDGAILYQEGGPGKPLGGALHYSASSSVKIDGTWRPIMDIGTKLVPATDPNASQFVDQEILFSRYVGVPEYYSTDGLMSFRKTLRHEIGHLLMGYMDCYYNPNDLGLYAISASGGYFHPAAMEKHLWSRWIESTPLETSGSQTLTSHHVTGGTAYDPTRQYLHQIAIDGNPNHLLYIENRHFVDPAQGGSIYDQDHNGTTPESGLVIFEMNRNNDLFDRNQFIRHVPARITSPYHSAEGAFQPGDSFLYETEDMRIAIDNISTIGDTVSYDLTIQQILRPKLYRTMVADVGTDWQVIALPRHYNDPVVVATAAYRSNDLPAVVRARIDADNQVSVCLQQPSGRALNGTADVHLTVVEAGSYTLAEHGVTMEAGHATITTVDSDSSWNGQTLTTINSYSQPVVLGQVVGDGESRWSQFWACGTSRSEIPTASAIRIGLHVAEDSDTQRSPQQVDYLVVEAGSGSIEGIAYHAAVGGESILGMGDKPPYSYVHGSSMANPSVVICASAGMNGSNGGWPVLNDNLAIDTTAIHLAIDEDQIHDSERGHIAERVAYFLLDGEPLPPAVPPMMHVATVTDVSSNWQSVTLPSGFWNPVVLATVRYPDANAATAVAQLRNITYQGCEVRVWDPAGQPRSGYSVEIFAIEAGVYTVPEHGIRAEAFVMSPSRLDYKNNWQGTKASLAQGYTQPVVLGSPQSTIADQYWLAFWSRGASASDPATSQDCYVGIHIGEDPFKSRSLSGMGIVVVETGDYLLGNTLLEAGVGTDTVQGMGNNPPYTYNLRNAMPTSVQLSMAGMDGGDGGWPVLIDLSDQLGIAIDEDTLGDSERSHTTEQVGYLTTIDIGGDG